MRLLAILTLIVGLMASAVCFAAEGEETEEEPYDERGFIRDNMRVSLSFTSGSTQWYNYDDLRIYITTDAHYAFRGDDYLDLGLLVNRFDRAYDDPRYGTEPLTDIFDMDLNYVFDGIDVETKGFRHVVGATLFSDTMFEDLDVGLGYGAQYNYAEGNLRLLGGFGRNVGYSDSWSPLLDLGWTHNQLLGGRWRLRTKTDLMWSEGREALDGEEAEPDAVYLLDGQISYELVKGWNVYVRYFNDNSSDYARNYWSMGLTHYYRKPRPRR